MTGVLVALAPAQSTYAYDSRGNRTSETPTGGSAIPLAYDQANRLTAYGTTATYSYNGDGLRMSKTVSGGTSQSTWAPGQGVPLQLVDGATTYIYGVGGRPLEQVGASGALYYYQDQLGSTRALVTQGGTVSATYTYDSYGHLSGLTGGLANPFGYAGQYTDIESGFVYLRARYYDPGTAQFINRDPLAQITDEAYGYSAEDPLNSTDPTGLWSWQLTKTLLKVGALVTSAAAVVADASGVGFPVGALLGEASAGFSLAAARVQCHYGNSTNECQSEMDLAAFSFVTAGVGGVFSLGSLAESLPSLAYGVQFVANGASYLSSALSMRQAEGASGRHGFVSSGQLQRALGANDVGCP